MPLLESGRDRPADLITIKQAIAVARCKPSMLRRAVTSGLLRSWPPPDGAPPGRGRPLFVREADVRLLAAEHAFETPSARRERLSLATRQPRP